MGGEDFIPIKEQMKQFSNGSTVAFAYAGKPDLRYVEIIKLNDYGFEGADWSKRTGTDSGYRSFKYANIDFSSFKVIAAPDENYLPNTEMTVATLLERIGLNGKFRLDEEEGVVIFKKNLLTEA